MKSVSKVFPPPASSRFGKTDCRYWQSRVSKKLVSSIHYSISMQHAGKRVRFPLHTANKYAAANLATEIFKCLISEGWETAIFQYAATRTPLPDPAETSPVILPPATLGAWLNKARALSRVSARSFGAYETSVRRVVADLQGFSTACGLPKERPAAIASADAVPLESIVGVDAWARRYLNSRSGDPVERERATRTCNSILRNCRAVFSAQGRNSLRAAVSRELENDGWRMPEKIPFDDCDLEEETSAAYRPEFSAESLFGSAFAELPKLDEGAFVLFLLAACAGLRRNEADKLLWEQVDIQRCEIHIRTTRYMKPKWGSGGIVPIDLPVSVLLHDFHSRHPEETFVIPSPIAPRINTRYGHYRADQPAKVLLAWLREHGVSEIKAIHTLRKEFGSQLAEKLGIYAASKALRHSTVSTTERAYVERRNTGALLLSDLMPPGKPSPPVLPPAQ